MPASGMVRAAWARRAPGRKCRPGAPTVVRPLLTTGADDRIPTRSPTRGASPEANLTMSEDPRTEAKAPAPKSAGADAGKPPAKDASAPEKGGEAAAARDASKAKDPGKDKDAGKPGADAEGKDKGKDKDKSKDKVPEKDKGKDAVKGGDKDAGEKKEKAPRKPFRIPEPALLAAVVVAGLVLGGLVGDLLLAPPLVAARNARALAPPPAPRPRAAKKGEREKPAVYRVDNIVVNPAGSAGSRFVMATVAFELPDEKAVEALRDRDVELRDAVITTFESQTLEMLAAPGAREALKRRLLVATKPMLGDIEPVRIYLPQYVIQ